MLESAFMALVEWVFTVVVAAKVVLPESFGFIGAIAIVGLVYWATLRTLS